MVLAFSWRPVPTIPLPAAHGSLPPSFDAALKAATERARSGEPDAARALARLYQANRLYPEARACYRVVAAGPGGLAARDHYYLAAMALDDSDLSTAVDELRATLLAEPGYLPARIALADALFKQGLGSAQDEYAAVLAAEPNQPQASFGMARIELQRNLDDAAVARLRSLVSAHPESSAAEALLAGVLVRHGEVEEAASLTARSQQARDPVPRDPWMASLLVDCYDRQLLALEFEKYRLTGQLDEAMPLMRRLEDVDPNSWITPMLRGWSEKEAGRFPEAVKDYEQSLANGGDPDKICPLLVNALLNEGKEAEAARLLEGYRAKAPHSVPILKSYAEVAVRMGDEKLARSLLIEVLQAEPNLYMPNMSLIGILWKSGEHDKAAPLLKRVAATFQGDIDSRGLLAQYYLESSDPVSAIAPLEQAVALAAPPNPRHDRLAAMLDTAYLMAGSLAASGGNFAAAQDYAEKSIALMPAKERGYALKAKACHRRGDYRGAADALGKLSALVPSEPLPQQDRGDELFLAGDPDGARPCWQRALELAPADAADLRAALELRLSGRATAELIKASPTL